MNFGDIQVNKKNCIEGSNLELNTEVDYNNLADYLINTDNDYQQWKEAKDSWDEIARASDYIHCGVCKCWYKNIHQHNRTKKHGKALIKNLN